MRKRKMKKKASLSNIFKMKDLRKANNCIGINIHQLQNEISLDQIKYIEKILERFGMSDCKPRDVNTKLSTKMCENGNLVGEVQYQEAVGSLLYLVQGTNDVSRFNNMHGEPHWQAVKRIFRYLKGTINFKLHFSDKSPLIAYSDSDWASDVDKRRSCTGYIFTMSGSAIYPGNRKGNQLSLYPALKLNTWHLSQPSKRPCGLNNLTKRWTKTLKIPFK